MVHCIVVRLADVGKGEGRAENVMGVMRVRVADGVGVEKGYRAA